MPAVALLLFFFSYSAPRILATLKIDGLSEASGMAASRQYPGVIWSHNDSGLFMSPRIFAFDHAGKLRADVAITGARMRDWEAIAIGPKNTIYIGDIGDNFARWNGITLYVLPEPRLGAKRVAAKAIRLKYPDGARDAEVLLVHPISGEIYIITKRDPQPRVYQVVRGSSTLRRVGTLSFTSFMGLTDGNFSPDGKRIVLCDYFRAYEAPFDLQWDQKWTEIDLGKRVQGESVTYSHDGSSILATSEGDEFPLIEVRRY